MGNSRDEAIQQAYDTYDSLILDKQYIRKNYDEGELRIDRETGVITLLLRWKYFWAKKDNVKRDWTELEKSHFSTMADSAIRQVWNGKALFSVSGYSDFARKFSGKKLSFGIEIIPVNRNQHWWVTVYKVNSDDFEETYVWHYQRSIQFEIKDIEYSHLCDYGKEKICIDGQIGVPHEVGHIMGWLGSEMSENNDEYYDNEKERKERLPNSSDVHALMNIGMELRPRYFKTVIKRLNEMFANTTFSLVSMGE